MFNVLKLDSYNSLGTAERAYHDYESGVIGQQDNMRFDVFGNMYFSYKNNGASSHTIKYLCSSSRSDCPQNAAYLIVTTYTDKPAIKSYYDFSMNLVKSGNQLIDGTWSITRSIYDNRGRAYKVSVPYIEGSSVPGWAISEIDAFDRKAEVRSVDGLITKFTYSYGNIEQEISGTYSGQTTVNMGRTRSERRNGRAELIETIDPLNGSTHYEYNALGLVSIVQGVDLHSTEIVYDKLGRRTTLIDVDKGTIKFIANALGEEVSKTAPGNVIEKEFKNAVGQTVSKTYSFNNSSITNHFTYEKALLKTESSQDSTKTYFHDSLNRLARTEYNLEGKVWNSYTHYDQFGRPFRDMDISGNNRGVQYQYKNGHLDRLFEVKTGQAYYRATKMDAYANIVEASVADGIDVKKEYEDITGRLKSLKAGYGLIQNESYGYDQLGNLRHRINYHGTTQTLKETFSYDDLNRLTNVYFNGANTQSIRYYANGNIKHKSDVENNSTYTYGTRASGCLVTPGAHAVTQIATRKYCYDARGNQLKEYRNSSLNRDVQYNLFDKASRIWSSQGESLFSYDANNTRYKRVDNEGGQTTTTYYVGNNEVIYYSDNSSEIKRYIQDIAIHSIKNTGSEELLFTFKDHLGSGNIITNKKGDVKARMSFDAFGKRRNADTWLGYQNPYTQLSNLSEVRAITQKGFTGHIQVDHASVIHMGGRIYDPAIGRFMQADPIIQDVRDAQSINRYSYVFNNPLSYTDPTGYNCVNENAPTCAAAINKLTKKTAEANSDNSGNSSNAEVNSGNASSNKINSTDSTYDAVDIFLDTGVAIAEVFVPPIEEIGEALQEALEGKFVDAAIAIGGVAAKKVKGIKKVGETISEGIDKLKKVNPNDIELSHPASLSKSFSDPRNGTVGDLAEKLKMDPNLADKIPPIEVIKINGKTYSANNRRLRAFQEAKVDVPSVPASKEQARKVKQRLQNKKK